MLNEYFINEYNYFDDSKPKPSPSEDERVKVEDIKFDVESYRTERAYRKLIGYVKKQD
jgi:hypothetical protein